ncbi:MAG: transposase [Myxococcales bacterium]|nr:transposase [Myxococcales bacterium]
MLYGHKICLRTGASGLVLDCVIESGNPSDATLAVAMVEHQIELYGRPPKKVCFDGGFSSMKDLEDIKNLDVEDVAVNKSPGIGILDMVKSSWAYRKLRRFRAGIESNVSFLKRSFGWSRCTLCLSPHEERKAATVPGLYSGGFPKARFMLLMPITLCSLQSCVGSCGRHHDVVPRLAMVRLDG